MKQTLLLLVLLGLCGCGTPSESSSATPTPRLADPAHAALILQISNQSPIDKAVELTVSLDGTQLIQQRFPVESQHHVVSFPVQLVPGAHVLKVVADSGVTLEESLMMPASGVRYAVLSYVNDDDYDGDHVAHRIRKIDYQFLDHVFLIS